MNRYYNTTLLVIIFSCVSHYMHGMKKFFALYKQCAQYSTKKLLSQTIHHNNLTFQIPQLSDESFIKLTPQPELSSRFDTQSAIAKTIHTIWNLNQFNIARKPLEISAIKDSTAFCQPSDIRILDMPIKFIGSNEYRLPQELEQFAGPLQQIIDHEHAMLSEEQLKKYYAYLTIDQSMVQEGTTQRNAGLHVDGFQGARIQPKTLINHTYIAMNRHPTTFYPQTFDFSHLEEAKHNFFLEMERVAQEKNAMKVKLLTAYLIDAYTPHKASLADDTGYRTFLRLSYDPKEFDRLGNTYNPHSDYSWNMTARDAHAMLKKYIPEK